MIGTNSVNSGIAVDRLPRNDRQSGNLAFNDPCDWSILPDSQQIGNWKLGSRRLNRMNKPTDSDPGTDPSLSCQLAYRRHAL